MPGPIEHLPCTDSLLSRCDPRWKLAAMLLFGCAILVLHQLLPTAMALLIAVILALLGRLPWRWCLTRLGLVLLVLAPFLILMPFLQRQSEPAWTLGPLQLSWAGVGAASQLALKTLALTLLVLILLTTAPLPVTFQAAQSLRLPGLLTSLCQLTYRFIFVLAAELARLRVALRLRGYRNRPTLHSYRTVGHVTGMLLVRGYEQSERVEQAMRCRGFDGRFRTLTDFQTRLGDVAGFFGIAGCAAALIAWDHGWWMLVTSQ